MADTLGEAQLDGFIPEIWANTALQVLRSNIALARLVSKDSDVAAFSQGDVLNIPVPGTFTTNDKAAGTAVTLQNPSAPNVTVTLDQHKEVSFVIEDVAAAQANQDLVLRHVTNAAVAIAEKIETDLFALHDGFSTSVGTSTVDLVASTIRAARGQLNTNKCPLAGRFAVFNSDSELSLLADSELRDYFANAQPEAVAEGSMGRVYGFDMFMSQITPGTAPAKGVAGTREMGILAMRGLPTTRAPGVVQMNMRDPQSGLVIRQTASYDADLLGMKITLDVLYGIDELRDACGVKLLH